MQNLKILILILICGLCAAVYADTKIYIGNEDSQLIVGISSLVGDVDGAAGLEIRTYFAKKGLVINDIEYGAVPGRTVYTATLAGKTGDGAFAKYRHNWAYALDETTVRAAENSLEIGYGQGPNILTH
ncbi:MAG: hypothetical protein LBD99_04190 [Candidatus Margulisbacteria bacterium]|jgi:hypothetical protein|nr:hypothetical protein [Candidatus Margulisiibacteriota bacterium]